MKLSEIEFQIYINKGEVAMKTIPLKEKLIYFYFCVKKICLYKMVLIISTFALQASFAIESQPSDEGRGGFSNLATLSSRIDGQFDVVCKSGEKQVASEDELLMNRICGGGKNPRVFTMTNSPKEAYCTKKGESELKSSCAAALIRGAVKECLELGLSGKFEQIPGTFDFKIQWSDTCTPYSSRWVYWKCEETFRCLP